MKTDFQKWVASKSPVEVLMGCAFRRAVWENPDDMLVVWRLDRLIFDKREFVSRQKTLDDFGAFLKEYCRQNHIRISDLQREGEIRWYWNPEVGLVRKRRFRPVSECRFVKRMEEQGEDHARYNHWEYWNY